MDFAEALVSLKSGMKVARKSVKDDGGRIKFYLYLDGDKLMAEYSENEVMNHEFIAIRTCDILATDWFAKAIEKTEEIK